MAVTITSVLSEIQRVTIENAGDGGATWPSGMWTLPEVLNYLYFRQDRWLGLTGLRWTVLETALTLAQSDQAAPVDWIASVFLAYKSDVGLYQELPKMDAFELDGIAPTWPGTSTPNAPRGYTETDGPTLTTQVVPAPTAVGSALERYYVAKGDRLGTDFSVPDEYVPTIKYGTLADMFSKVGPAQNLALAARCEARWQEGVELGKLAATEGWFAL